jgi:hypothetical protein
MTVNNKKKEHPLPPSGRILREGLPHLINDLEPGTTTKYHNGSLRTLSEYRAMPWWKKILFNLGLVK